MRLSLYYLLLKSILGIWLQRAVDSDRRRGTCLDTPSTAYVTRIASHLSGLRNDRLGSRDRSQRTSPPRLQSRSYSQVVTGKPRPYAFPDELEPRF